MNPLARIASIALLGAALACPPALAVESCRNPTADQQDAIDACKAHAGCRFVFQLNLLCSSMTEAIRSYFSKQQETPSAGSGSPQDSVDAMDPDRRQSFYQGCIARNPGPGEKERCWDLYATTAMREQKAQAERDKANQGRAAAEQRQRDEARHRKINLTVKDESLQKRLGQNCSGKDLTSSYCFYTLQEAERLGDDAATFNADPLNAREPGTVKVLSPDIAAQLTQARDKVMAPAEAPASAPPPSQTALRRTGSGGGATELLKASVAQADQAAHQAAARQQQQEQQEQLRRRTLETGTAGELFAMVDQHTTAGLTDKAHQAFQAMLRRFPNDPLTASANRRMIDEQTQRERLLEAQRRQAADAEAQRRAAADLDTQRRAQQAQRDREETAQALETLKQTVTQIVQQRAERKNGSSGGAGGSGPCPAGQNMTTSGCRSGVAQ